MTRKEQLEQQYQKSRAANGYGTQGKALQDGPKGVGLAARVVKRTITFGVIATALWWAYRVFVVAKPMLDKEEVAEVESVTDGDSSEYSDGKPAGMAAKECGRVTVDQLKAYLTPSEAEIIQLYGYVAQAPFVTENLQYRERIGGADFLYVATNDVVNAFAGRRVVEAEGKKSLKFHTVMLGGAARYARMVGLAAAVQDAGREGELKRFISHMPPYMCGECNEDKCIAYLQRRGLADAIADPQIRQRAISYSSGTIVSVLAHESGHHALGHLLNISEKSNLEIDRNQEREADSFASSVISASPFGEYIFAGTLFWHYAVAMQSDGSTDARRNHPLSKERFENFVRANREKAEAMGISVK